MTAQAAPTHASPLWSSPLRTSRGELLESRGAHVCLWIETNCVYGEGDWYGLPVVLREFQQRFIYRLYEYYPSGLRRYKRALLGMAKGNGKSPLAAWVSAHELLCEEPECMVLSPRVLVGAGSLKQANLVFGDLRTTVTESATLGDRVEAMQREIQLRDRPGVAERIAAEAGTNDGAHATVFVADELHEWTGQWARGYLVVSGALAKRRNAFSLAISTAGINRASTEDDPNTLLDLYEYGKKVSAGEITDDAFLFEWYEAPPDLDLDDEDQLRQAIEAANPATVCDEPFNSMEELAYLARTMPRHEFRRYRLNQFVEPIQEQPIPLDKWDECEGTLRLTPGQPVWCGLDAALSRDSAAFTVAGLGPDNRLHTRTTIFEAGTDGIDFATLENACRLAAKTYDVQELAYDPNFFERSAQVLSDEGVRMVEVRQDNTNMVPASQALYDAVVSGMLLHDGDVAVRSHVQALAASEQERGWRISKRRSRGRIDAVVALCLAVWRVSMSETAANPSVTVLGISGDNDCRACGGTGEREFLGEPLVCGRCQGTGVFVAPHGGDTSQGPPRSD